MFIGLIALLCLFIFYFVYSQKENQSDQRPAKPINEEISMENFTPKTKHPGNESEYEIDLKLHSDGSFYIQSTVNIKNTSPDMWDKLVFYFIPNMFTEENSPELSVPATHQFNQIEVNGKTNDFQLNEDTLRIPLSENLYPNQEIEVQFTYELTLPEEGLRFTKIDENYYLSQFYPMLATYRDHQWNKEPYQDRGETYHTAFSNFKIDYEIPDDYIIASTSEEDTLHQSKGSLTAKQVKEVFIALLKNPEHETTKSGDTTIRVFGDDNRQNQEISEEAVNAFSYFEEKVGPYPFKQLDIVIGTISMEYPGIVTIGSIYDVGGNAGNLKPAVVHEIAHQWFYGMISNDPYNDAWLDEGFATFAQGLYSYSALGEEPYYQYFNDELKSDFLNQYPIDLALNEYPKHTSSYVYGKSDYMLWKLFEDRGDIKGAEDFLKTYFHLYQYKEVDTKEFIRFMESYFDEELDSFFKEYNIFK